MEIQIPKILECPPKLYPIITNFNNYTYFLEEGGRGSGKTQFTARLILTIGEKRKIKVCCGREIQRSIENSVKSVFDGLVQKYNLDWRITDKELVHRKTGSRIFFQGFREQGAVSIKGLDDVDILWIDEAQAITKPTLDIVVPTIIRKNNSKIIFTMNRFVRNDAVYKFCVGRSDCLHINIQYYDNPYLNDAMKHEAEVCKAKNIKDYEHIWLGYPLSQASDFLLSSDKVEFAKNIEFPKENHPNHKVMAVDLSASGGDLCVAKLLEQKTMSSWEDVQTSTWAEPDTDITKGKIINLYGIWKPDILIIDADGLGYPIWVSVKKSIDDAIGFRGAGKARNLSCGNARADGYMAVKEFIDNGWLKLRCENTCRQLEYIKRDFKPSGLTFMQNKKDIRKEQSESPDFADTLMMGVYAITYHSHLFTDKLQDSTNSYINSDFNPYE
jgi:hypothetical protein